MNIILKPLNRALINLIVRNEIINNEGLEQSNLDVNNIDFLPIEEVIPRIESFLTRETNTNIILKEDERLLVEKAYWDLELSTITIESYQKYIKMNFMYFCYQENKAQHLNQQPTRAQIQEERLNKIKDIKTTEDTVELYKDTIKTMIDLGNKHITVNGVTLDSESTAKTIAPLIMASYYQSGAKVSEQFIIKLLESNPILLDQLETLSETKEILKMHMKQATKLNIQTNRSQVIKVYRNGLLAAQEASTSNLLLRFNKEYFILDKKTLGELIMLGKAPMNIGTELIPERYAKIEFDSYNEETPFVVVIPKNTPII